MGEGVCFFAHFLGAQDCQPTITAKLIFVRHLDFSSIFRCKYAILLDDDSDHTRTRGHDRAVRRPRVGLGGS